MSILTALTVPFLGTMLGAMAVFGLGTGSQRVSTMLSAFAGGAMLAAAFWSLLLEGAAMNGTGTAAGFLVCLVLAAVGEAVPEGRRAGGRGVAMLLLALVLHNIPEGMAVGIAETGDMGIMTGIAAQNIPDGAVAAAVLAAMGLERKKAFALGTMTGAVEPVAALAVMGLRQRWGSLGPGLMGFAAGAMVYVLIRELAPRMNGDWRGMCWFAAGVGLILVLA